jgi:hypothetical protein
MVAVKSVCVTIGFAICSICFICSICSIFVLLIDLIINLLDNFLLNPFLHALPPTSTP